MIRRPPRATLSSASAASDVYKRQPPIDEFKGSAERGFGKIESGDDQRFARAQDGTGHGRFGHGGERRGVARTDVLGQGGLDGAANFCGGQFHAVRMKPNGKGEKKKRVVEKTAEIVMACPAALV